MIPLMSPPAAGPIFLIFLLEFLTPLLLAFCCVRPLPQGILYFTPSGERYGIFLPTRQYFLTLWFS